MNRSPNSFPRRPAGGPPPTCHLAVATLARIYRGKAESARDAGATTDSLSRPMKLASCLYFLGAHRGLTTAIGPARGRSMKSDQAVSRSLLKRAVRANRWRTQHATRQASPARVRLFASLCECELFLRQAPRRGFSPNSATRVRLEQRSNASFNAGLDN